MVMCNPKTPNHTYLLKFYLHFDAPYTLVYGEQCFHMQNMPVVVQEAKNKKTQVFSAFLILLKNDTMISIIKPITILWKNKS